MLRPPRISSRTLRPRHSEEAGFTIIEVLVAALIVAIVAAGGAVAFVGAIGTSGIQRNRSAAEALAQQNQARLTGYTVGQLANLNQTLSPVPLDGTQYTIQESATFVSDSSGTPSCTNPSADYLQTTSTVTWSGMPSSLHGVTVTGLITPAAGQTSSSAGVLAVQVEDPSANPIAGMPVSVSGPSSASGVTAADGCVLFGDLPVATSYIVHVTPASGSYVDADSGQAVNTGSPDNRTVSVSAGTTAAQPTPFVLATPGTATFSFTDNFPTGVSPSPAPTATSPAVVLTSGNLTIVCSAQDTSGCPSASNPDTSWGSGAWNGTSGQVFAQPLAPNAYSTYAGICANDDPHLSAYGGLDATTVVTAGNNTTTPLTLASIVVRLYSGTGSISVLGGTITLPNAAGSEVALPSGSELVITDTGCASERYVGGPGVSVPPGDSYLPINSSPVLNAGANDTGLLADPGMPDGQYTVCLQSNGKKYQTTLTNKGNGEIVNIFANSPTGTGSCGT